MGVENQKPDTPPEPQPGFSQKKIVYTIIAVAIVILAVVLVAKFGYNVDLLNPASGEMSIAMRHIPQTTVPKSVLKPIVKDITTPATSPTPTSIQGLNCPTGQTICSGVCTSLKVDPNHCGTCGNKCASEQFCFVGVCTSGCPGGSGLICNGECVDIMTNPDHCGGCGCKASINTAPVLANGLSASSAYCTNGAICYVYLPRGLNPNIINCHKCSA